MDNILNDGFKNEINGNVIALKFEENSKEKELFNQIYPINKVPSLYLISSGAVVLDLITGFVEKSDLIDKVNAALDKQKQLKTDLSGNQSNHAAEATSNDQATVRSDEQSNDTLSLKRANESPAKTDKDLKDKEKHAQELLKELRVKKAKEEEQRALDMEKEVNFILCVWFDRQFVLIGFCFFSLAY